MMFSRLRMSTLVAKVLVVTIGSAMPAPAAMLPAAGAPPPAADLSAQAGRANIVQVSVCVARELAAAWEDPPNASKMSDFKDAAATYIEGRRATDVQYFVTPRAFSVFDARNPNAVALEVQRAGQPCPATTEAYTIPVEGFADAPVVSTDVGDRCNALASEPGDPRGAGGGAARGEINVNEALPVCQAAASARPLVPRYVYLYARVLEDARRYSEAAAQYTTAAEAGDPNAADALAGLYYSGQGVPRSLDQAVRYCRQAADAGVPGAEYRMGFLYLWGEGVQKDFRQAAAWFRKAGDAGFADAYGYLGRIYAIATPPDFTSAVAWLKYAADKGSPVGALNLGYLYELGHGVPQDDVQAVTWFRFAAERNDPNAMRQLGLHLRAGKGVRWSEAEAMEWFGKAARLGDIEAESLMAYGYMNGLGQDAGQGRQDYGEAARLFGHAATAGDPVAQLDLGVLYANGWGVSQDLPRARSLFAQAADSGVPEVAARARQLSATLTTASAQSAQRGDPSWVAPAIGIGLVALLGYALFSGGSSSGGSGGSSDSGVYQDPMSSGSNYNDFVFNCTVGGGSINIFGDCGTSSGIPIPAPR